MDTKYILENNNIISLLENNIVIYQSKEGSYKVIKENILYLTINNINYILIIFNSKIMLIREDNMTILKGVFAKDEKDIVKFYNDNNINNRNLLVGSSCANIKKIKLNQKIILGHNLVKPQSPDWNDKFEFSIKNNELIVKRTDLLSGWDQNMILPIKHKKILIYNGFACHYEMSGFILEFCNKYNIEAVLVEKYPDRSWREFYFEKYKFKFLPSLPQDLNSYLFVILLTDDDKTFPDNLINKNTVCVNHSRDNRRTNIEYQIPISCFGHGRNYTLPIFEYISYEDKIKLLDKNKTTITLLGNSVLPKSIEVLYFIDNFKDFNFNIINRKIPLSLKETKNSNVFFFENPSTKEMFDILVSSNYFLYIHNDTDSSWVQSDIYSISANIPLSFTTLNKLIIPKHLNKYLNLKNVVMYEEGKTLYNLEKNPPIEELNEERKKLIEMRDNNLFNLDHIKLFYECIMNIN